MSNLPVSTLVEFPYGRKICRGIVCYDFGGMANVCCDDETPVHPLDKVDYDPAILGVATEAIKKLATIPENLQLTDSHIQNVCRIGCGEATCKFLVMTPDGFQCARGSRIDMMLTLEFSDTKSKLKNCPGRIGTVSSRPVS